MATLDDNTLNIDLKCDFPAREAFREELRTRLQAMAEAEPWQPTVVKGLKSSESNLDMRELSDSELELLSAAQGHVVYPEGWHEESQD